MLFKKIFKPKIEREKLDELRKIAFKFDNQAFTEDNYDFLYDELERFKAINYAPTLIYSLQIAQQKRDLNRDVIESEEKNSRNFSQYFFEEMTKVIDFILSKYQIRNKN